MRRSATESPADSNKPPGTDRAGGGGGVMSVMKGGCSGRRLYQPFTKILRGVRRTSPARKTTPGSGHRASHWCPCVRRWCRFAHMNTRFIVTSRPGSEAAIGDVSMMKIPTPSRAFKACDKRPRVLSEVQKGPGDVIIFFLPHRDEPRGRRGIADYVDSGDYRADHAGCGRAERLSENRRRTHERNLDQRTAGT